MAPLHVTLRRDNAAEKGLPSEIFAGDDETGEKLRQSRDSTESSLPLAVELHPRMPHEA